MIKLLWVDNNLFDDLTDLRLALYMEDDFDPHFAVDASDALHKLKDPNLRFDVVIFDLLHPSGPDNYWDPHREKGVENFGAVLFEMVKSNAENWFSHLAGAKIGVFTIESKEDYKRFFEAPYHLPEANFENKVHTFYEEDFIQFIRNVHDR